MSRGAAAAALGLALACAGYALRPPEPPADARQRRAAELDACRAGTLPPWLDDAALSTASRLDGQEGQAAAMNDAFITDSAAAAARPPPPGRGGSRVEAILRDRRAFETECALLRSAGRELVPGGKQPPAR